MGVVYAPAVLVSVVDRVAFVGVCGVLVPLVSLLGFPIGAFVVQLPVIVRCHECFVVISSEPLSVVFRWPVTWLGIGL